MTLFYGSLLSFILMLIAWCVYYYSKTPGIIDVFWGANITLIGLTHLLSDGLSTIKIVTLILLALWGVRLSIFLYVTRIKTGTKDQRYKVLSQHWKDKKTAFLWHYLFQGLLAFIIALPFYMIPLNALITPFYILCFILIFLGIIGESIADHQLLQHKKNAGNEVCQQGLWQYSRHPNYFFECLVWLGFSLLGLSGEWGFISLTSIATLFCIMWFFTVPITEKVAIKKRGVAYVTYQKTTSRFMPWFKA